MTSDEIRQAFLRFFEERGHTVIPSSSLVPRGDPTLLLTNAGMVQIKPYFTGEATPPNVRLASCQKCFRTTDIEEVGDHKHLTFFEMLGNFSVGDYFKKEAIAWAWEFVTQHLRLPLERLWFSVYLDDDEAYGCWREVGVPEERLVRYGEEDNFWGPAGDSGPCGPCSEIFYDFGEEHGCGKPTCGPNCDCERFTEVGNLVFTEYNQDAEGHRTPLPKKNIDTGFGLERAATILQGKQRIYDSDLFAPIVQRMVELSGREYGRDEATDRAIMIVVEHGRAIAFLIGDGVIPSNEGRGYVLRRVLRRAALFGRKLGLEEPFLAEVAKFVIAQMGHVYPELTERQDFVLKVIGAEEERFGQTLTIGLTILEGVIEEAKKRKEVTISGDEAFALYDTYGFPVELTQDIATENGMTVDIQGFGGALERQRERARAAQKLPYYQRLVPISAPVAHSGTTYEEAKAKALEQARPVAIKFTGYDEVSTQSVVMALGVGGEVVDAAYQAQDVEVVLNRTPFYGEMGGQVGDTGEIRGEKGKVVVTDTFWPQPELIVHRGRVVEGELSVGDVVEAEVDSARRLDIARNHTATHLLQAALRKVLGAHIYQSGSLVAPDRFRFDFTHPAALTDEELSEVQRIVNDAIRRNLRVAPRMAPYREAINGGAIALFDEKYGDEVRLVEILDDSSTFSAELCGGTHVGATGEIGFFQIMNESSIGAGMRRIEAVTGRGAEEFVEQRLSALRAVSRNVRSPESEVDGAVTGILSELESERRRSASLQRELSRQEAESLLSKAVVVDGVQVVAARVTAPNAETLRQMGDLVRDKLGSGVVVLGAIYDDRPNFVAMVTPDLVAKGFHAGRIAKEVAVVAWGGGGGRAGLGQAGGKDKGKLDEALRRVGELLHS